MNSSSDTVEITPPPRPTGENRPRPCSAAAQVDVSGQSDIGLVRSSNEDHFFVARFGRFLENLHTNLSAEEMPRLFEETGYGVLVADGMGGHVAGEVASKLAINTFINLVLGTPDWILRLDDGGLSEEVKRRLLERFGQVGAVMADQARADPELEGFGTTMTLAMSLGKSLFVAHVGDSRAYLLRDKQLHQLTRDHTLAQLLVDRGRLDQGEVAQHQMRHILTRSLGDHSKPVQPDIQEINLEQGDQLLICTDGLTEMVPDHRIQEILPGCDSSEQACRRLVEEALAAGGKDNVTVVVLRYSFPVK